MIGEENEDKDNEDGGEHAELQSNHEGDYEEEEEGTEEKEETEEERTKKSFTLFPSLNSIPST